MKAINSNQDADFVILAPSEVDDGKIISYENFVNAIICDIPSKILFEKISSCIVVALFSVIFSQKYLI